MEGFVYELIKDGKIIPKEGANMHPVESTMGDYTVVFAYTADGKVVGPCEGRDDEGNLRFREKYLGNGLKTGKSMEYTSTGKPYKRSYYESGEQVGLEIEYANRKPRISAITIYNGKDVKESIKL